MYKMHIYCGMITHLNKHHSNLKVFKIFNIGLMQYKKIHVNSPIIIIDIGSKCKIPNCLLKGNFDLCHIFTIIASFTLKHQKPYKRTFNEISIIFIVAIKTIV